MQEAGRSDVCQVRRCCGRTLWSRLYARRFVPAANQDTKPNRVADYIRAQGNAWRHKRHFGISHDMDVSQSMELRKVGGLLAKKHSGCPP